MRYDEMVALVAQETGADREQAERAIQATLRTLAERITAGEARDLASQLPAEAGPWLATTNAAERFDVDEFLGRVAERAGVDRPTAERHARAVFDALARAVTTGEFQDMAAQLPKDYAFLLPRGRYVEMLPAATFVQRVAERARLDSDGAWRATDAVLETLAERIAGGEVDDLVSRLAPELHPPLKRGNESSHGVARRMSLDDFVQRVAEREDVDVATAREHVAAVLAVLREAVGDEEFFDVTVQLPSDYVSLLARA